jgi:hypothetical protein
VTGIDWMTNPRPPSDTSRRVDDARL